MTESSEQRYFALYCDGDGTVVRIARDEMDGSGNRQAGTMFWELLASGSESKGRQFFRELVEGGVAFGWEMDLRTDGRAITLHFAGGRTPDGTFLIVASVARSGVADLYAELMQISNEQANALRAAQQQRSREQRQQSQQDHTLYEELTRANNELATVQRELSRKNAELERLNAQKNHFLGLAAHDLRNPIGVIRSWSSFLLEDGATLPQEKWVEFLGRIRTSSDFMLRLLDELLDISVIESGRLELNRSALNLAALVGATVDINRILASQKGITVEIQASDGPLVAMVDAVKLEQVLNNLISNAVKFSSPGSSVTVEVTRAGEMVRVAVRDAGPGIPPGERAALFTPFGRTSVHSTAGERSTGLGLAIAKRIIDAHGGRIWCESEVGVGSTFAFEIRLAEPATPAPAEIGAPA